MQREFDVGIPYTQSSTILIYQHVEVYIERVNTIVLKCYTDMPKYYELY
jgi:hypothetical protein